MDVRAVAGVYRIRNTVNGKVYVGSSVDVHDRLRHHRESLARNTHINRHLQAAFNAYGADAFEFDVVDAIWDAKKKREAGTLKAQLLGWEQLWIDHYESHKQDNGYNINPRADSCLGVVHSEERRRHNSEAQKGKKYDDEYKRRMSERTKGRVFSDEHRKNHADANRRPEVRARRSAATKGIPKSEETRARMREAQNRPDRLARLREQCNGQRNYNSRTNRILRGLPVAAPRVPKERVAWNKGLTKETDPRIAAYAAQHKGYRFSEESKAKMRHPRPDGFVPWNKGKAGLWHPTAEWVERMRQRMLGRKFTDEHRQKLSTSLTGRGFSDEHRARLRASQNRPDTSARRSASMRLYYARSAVVEWT